MAGGLIGKLRFLHPRTGFELFLLLLLAILLASWVYTNFRSPHIVSGNLNSDRLASISARPAFAVPETIDLDLVRIHRAAEDEMARGMAQRWQARGRPQNINGVYEFSVIPYKPVFFMGAAKKGGLDRQKLLEEEMNHFQGVMDPNQKSSEFPLQGQTFLCAPFRRGSGLVALSAICVWDDADSAGFGLRIAGGDIQDTLRYTAEARRLLMNPGTSVSFGEDRPPMIPKNEPELNSTVRDIVASLLSYNCRRFARFLPEGSEQLFRERVDPNVLPTIQDPVEKVCFALSVLQFPRSETMIIRQRDKNATDRVVLDLIGRVDRKTPVPFVVVKTLEGWRVDPDWALKQLQDYAIKMSLLRFAMNQQSFSAYSAQLRSKNARSGMADNYSEIGKTYIALSADRTSACASALSESGELFLIHLDSRKNSSYSRGSTLPQECPATSLDPTW